MIWKLSTSNINSNNITKTPPAKTDWLNHPDLQPFFNQWFNIHKPDIDSDTDSDMVLESNWHYAVILSEIWDIGGDFKVINDWKVVWSFYKESDWIHDWDSSIDYFKLSQWGTLLWSREWEYPGSTKLYFWDENIWNYFWSVYWVNFINNSEDFYYEAQTSSDSQMIFINWKRIADCSNIIWTTFKSKDEYCLVYNDYKNSDAKFIVNWTEIDMWLKFAEAKIYYERFYREHWLVVFSFITNTPWNKWENLAVYNTVTWEKMVYAWYDKFESILDYRDWKLSFVAKKLWKEYFVKDWKVLNTASKIACINNEKWISSYWLNLAKNWDGFELSAEDWNIIKNRLYWNPEVTLNNWDFAIISYRLNYTMAWQDDTSKRKLLIFWENWFINMDKFVNYKLPIWEENTFELKRKHNLYKWYLEKEWGKINVVINWIKISPKKAGIDKIVDYFGVDD